MQLGACKMQKQTATQQIYKYVKANKLATAKQIAQALNLNANTVSKLCWQMEQRNAMQQVKVEGMRSMYVAKRNAKFNKPKATKRTTTTAKRNTQVMEVKQAIVAMQKLLRKLEAV
jgi:DNA-binding transcriptional regulator YhcF (GntR family)